MCASWSGVPRCGVCHNLLAWIVEADRDTFDDELKASVPVLVDFGARAELGGRARAGVSLEVPAE